MDMEMKPCTECGAEIEAGVRACPECEYDPTGACRIFAGGIFIVALALGALSWIIWPLFLVTPIVLLVSVALFLVSFIAPPATGVEEKTYRLF